MTVFDVRFVRIEVKETCLCGKLNKNNLPIQDAFVAISFKIKLKGVILINLLFTVTYKLFFPAISFVSIARQTLCLHDLTMCKFYS